jgi:hypothetical protein
MDNDSEETEMDNDSEDDEQQHMLDWIEGGLKAALMEEFHGCETKVDAPPGVERQPSMLDHGDGIHVAVEQVKADIAVLARDDPEALRRFLYAMQCQIDYINHAYLDDQDESEDCSLLLEQDGDGYRLFRSSNLRNYSDGGFENFLPGSRVSVYAPNNPFHGYTGIVEAHSPDPSSQSPFILVCNLQVDITDGGGSPLGSVGRDDTIIFGMFDRWIEDIKVFEEADLDGETILGFVRQVQAVIDSNIK